MHPPSAARSRCRRVAASSVRLTAALSLATLISSCSGGDTSPTGPQFSKGGIPAVTVTSLADDGSAGTLRSVLAAAPSGANVTFAADLCAAGSHCTITLLGGAEHGLIIQGKNLQIIGPTGYTLAVDGGGEVGTVLTIDGDNGPIRPPTVTVKNLTLSGGGESFCLGDPGGIFVVQGNLALTNSVVTENVGCGGSVAGGIVQVGGKVTLTNVAVTNNQGGEIGGIWAKLGVFSMTNSVVTGNTGANIGGILNNGSQVTLKNSSVSGNTATQGVNGGGGGFTATSGEATETFNNSCINNNTVGSTTSSDPWDPINVMAGVGAGPVTGINCRVNAP